MSKLKQSQSRVLLLLLIVCAANLTSSCSQQRKRYEVESRVVGESRIHRLDTMLFSIPNTVEINPDSLTRNPVQEKRIKAGKPGILEFTGVRTIEADSLMIVNLQQDLVELGPGSDSIPDPETFSIWKTE